MLLRRVSQTVVPPGSPAALVNGSTLAVLRKLTSTPQYNTGGRVMEGWVTEVDSTSTNVQTYEQKFGEATISFVDSSRFISELTSSDEPTCRLPCMPRLIHLPGVFVASTSPLALEVVEETDTLGSVLQQAGFVVPVADFFKLPCYVYRLTNLNIKTMFGDDFASCFPYVRMFRRFGPGELLLQALQHDSDKRYLLSMSDIVGVKVDSSGDEIGVLLDALGVASTTELVTLINMVNAMNCIRFASIKGGSQDTNGIGLMFYYAMLDPGYLAKFPLDLIHAFGAADSSGSTTITVVDGVETPAIQAQIQASDVVHIPVLRAINDGNFVAIQKARTLYRMMLIVRYMEYRGYPLASDTTLKSTDRRQFFELLL